MHSGDTRQEQLKTCRATNMPKLRMLTLLSANMYNSVSKYRSWRLPYFKSS